MIQPKLCVIAETIIVSSPGNAPSIINFYEGGMRVESFPFVLPKLAVLVVWHRDETDLTQYQGMFSLRVGEQELVHQAVNIDFQDQPNARNIINIGGVIIPNPCTIEASIQVTEPQVTAQYSIEIVGNATPIVVVT